MDFHAVQSYSHSQVVDKELDGYLLFLEYQDVFTLGRFAKGKVFKDISVIETDRGGDITFHGRGQEVFYPLINLKKLGIKLRDYIEILHSFLIKFLSSKNIVATRSSKGPGLWVLGRKVCFLGIAVKKGVTLHGISINIDCDLEKFSLISPCGDSSIKVGNLTKLSKIPKDELRKQLADFFIEELNLFIS